VPTGPHVRDGISKWARAAFPSPSHPGHARHALEVAYHVLVRRFWRLSARVPRDQEIFKIGSGRLFRRLQTCIR
jgi:hypothetical protein